jgi:formylglycine-generating enzyme required for sulfatase activity
MKLEWQEDAPKNPMNWDEAMKYAKSLGDGWRLPTRRKL